uniref:Zinc finger CCCH type containing 6 n=1 Tax=Mus spicilegus TaxID=10103 RepID=A0A8C6HGV1_MUSSI
EDGELEDGEIDDAGFEETQDQEAKENEKQKNEKAYRKSRKKHKKEREKKKSKRRKHEKHKHNSPSGDDSSDYSLDSDVERMQSSRKKRTSSYRDYDAPFSQNSAITVVHLQNLIHLTQKFCTSEAVLVCSPLTAVLTFCL